MAKHTAQLRSWLDLLTTLAMGAVAVILLWRMVVTAAPGGKTEKFSAVENLQTLGLPLSLDQVHTQGSPLAPVVMIEFADFECPFCARFRLQSLDKLLQEFVAGGRVQFGFRHTPLKMHSLARPAAQASECADRQGKFWEAHDYLFNNQARLGVALWMKPGSGLNLDAVRFEECMAEPELPRVEADLLEASRFKIEATPTFVIGKRTNDGRILAHTRINGNQAYEVFKQALGLAATDSSKR